MVRSASGHPRRRGLAVPGDLGTIRARVPDPAGASRADGPLPEDPQVCGSPGAYRSRCGGHSTALDPSEVSLPVGSANVRMARHIPGTAKRRGVLPDRSGCDDTPPHDFPVQPLRSVESQHRPDSSMAPRRDVDWYRSSPPWGSAPAGAESALVWPPRDRFSGPTVLSVVPGSGALHCVAVVPGGIPEPYSDTAGCDAHLQLIGQLAGSPTELGRAGVLQPAGWLARSIR